MKKLEFKEAYYVAGWATELVKGFGVKVKQDNWSGEGTDYILFTPDMKRFTFENEAGGWTFKGVYFDYNKALEAAQREKTRYTKFCEDQVKEYSEKLNNL